MLLRRKLYFYPSSTCLIALQRLHQISILDFKKKSRKTRLFAHAIIWVKFLHDFILIFCLFRPATNEEDIGRRQNFPMMNDTPSLQISSSSSFNDYFACSNTAAVTSGGGEEQQSSSKPFIAIDCSDAMKLPPSSFSTSDYVDDNSIEYEISSGSTWDTKPYSTYSSG